ncbi:hypothetical protein [Neptunomonas japonica]|uniref:Polysaccharide biosynthesis protein n=1 Tax=Neptunomonas japonica JAMM 1380 TaxID=1441457 RepID=A0A7R6PAG2_9GAMM|nr:hypothetical protein [Neptunomonas japonica]BBB28869.1 hypothetical protein NEJAP_0912 [Neptunomonas japonica JAMM 1380]
MLKSFFNFYFLSSIGNAFISFIVIVYFSYYATNKEYVQLGVFSAVLGMMPSIIGMHTRSYFIRQSSTNDKVEIEDVDVLVSTFIWMIVSVAFLTFVLIFIDLSFLIEKELSWIVLIVGVGQWCHLTIVAVSHSKNNARRYFLFTIYASIVSGLGVIVLGQIHALVWQDRAYALMFGYLLSIIIFITWYRESIVKKIRIPAVNYKIIKYSIPLIPYSLSVSALIFFERQVVAQNFDSSVAASYLSQVQIVLIFSIFLDSLYKKITPVYFSTGNIACLYKTSLVAVCAFFIFYFISPWIFHFVFPATMYFNSNLMFFMLVSSAVIYILKLISLIFNYKSKNIFLSAVVIFSNIFTVMGLYFYSYGLGVISIPIIISVCNFLAVLVLTFFIWRHK